MAISLFVLWTFLSTLMFMCLSLPVQAVQPLLWSPTLLERSPEREKEFQAVNDWLALTSGLPLAMALEPDYEQLMKRFERNELAMIWVGPQLLQQLLAHRPDAPILAMTRDAHGKTDYQCVLFARHEFVGDATQAMQSSVALTQPMSTCGSVGARTLAQQSNVAFKDIDGHFTGSHQNVVVSVMLGETTSGIVASGVFDRFSWLPVHALLRSRSLPSFVWLVNPALVDSVQQQRLRDAFAQAQTAASIGSWYDALQHGFETNPTIIKATVGRFMLEMNQ
jgi:phosphonate transport system substrate-binding protein